LFKNSTPKVQQKNTGNNDLDLIGTINIPDEPITIVDKQPQDLNKELKPRYLWLKHLSSLR
jgi:hypothetical protein